jgi:periplasmic copper chaperone A
MRALVAGLVVSALLAGCDAPRDAAVDNAWIRLPAVTGRPGAAYFTLRGGKADSALARVSTPAARRSELHESMAAGGMMTMRPLAAVQLPAGGTVSFAPGGNHVMLFDIDPALRPGATTPLMLELSDGKRLTATAKVVAAGDPAP